MLHGGCRGRPICSTHTPYNHGTTGHVHVLEHTHHLADAAVKMRGFIPYVQLFPLEKITQ